MAIYIVRPRSAVVQSLGLAARSLSRKRRPDQITEVQKLRQSDRTVNEVKKMVKDYQGIRVWGGEQSFVTGVQLVDMTPDAAERMQRENIKEVVVLRDRPINLIDPLKPAIAKASVKPGELWHLPAVGLTSAVRKKLQVLGDGVGVAVLDTGIHEAHPEFIGKRIAGAVTLNTAKWKIQPQKKSTDTQGHGTHVAGIICGKNVGVAPAAKVWNVTMIPQGHGNLSDFILALEWAGQNPEIQIVNMSAGIPGWIEGMHDVLADLLVAGVLPAIAVGNEGANRTRSPGNYVEVLSVGASDAKNRVCSWSGGGTLNPGAHVYTVPDLVAPGDNILSSVMTGGYEAWSGTSMATPVVSGIAALVLEKYQDTDLTVTDLQQLLFDSCVNLKQPVDRQGKGLIQLPGIVTASKKPKLSVAGKSVVRAAKKKSTAKKKGGKKPASNKSSRAASKKRRA